MKFLLIFLIFINTLFAINIDKTWYENTNEELQKVYSEQLTKISTQNQDLNQEQKEQIDYQKLLLKRLTSELNYDTKLKFEKPTEIKDTDGFINTIKNYLQIDSSFESNQKSSDEKNSKLETLAEQISKIEDKELVSTTNSQLLYALYTIENKNIKEQSKVLQSLLDEYKEALLNALKNVSFTADEKLSEIITKHLSDLDTISKDEKRVSLLLDKAVISENQRQIDSNKKELEKIADKKTKLIDSIVFNKVEELIVPLKNKKSKYFDLNSNLDEFIQTNDVDYHSLMDLLKYLSRVHIGITKSTFADTKESIIDIVKFGWNEVNKPYIPLGDGVSILDITKFLFIFIIGFSLASFYRGKIGKANLKNSSQATKTLLANLGFYFLVFLTFIFALNSVGIDLSSLTILVGALSVGIGFGLQNIVSNFISGIILIFEKSIQVGNIIDIDGETKGRVTQINMRSSVITTFDNIDVIIPNSTLMQNNVTNWTFGDDIRRLNIPFGVAYGTDARRVIKIILEELEQSNLVYINDDMTKMPSVWMTGMGASSVDFKLLVWIHTNTNRAGLDSSNLSDFLIFIYEVLNKYEIEIPFPQMDVHLKKEKEEVETL